MRRALASSWSQGIHTSIPLHQRIFADPDFRAGNFDTNSWSASVEQAAERAEAKALMRRLAR